MTTLKLTRADDWHVHLRDGDALALTVGHTAKQFARAIVMPNLKPAVTTVAAASAYRDRILAAAHAVGATDFQPLMTLYLTDHTRAEEIEAARRSGFIVAVKLYPAGATTHSDAGVTSLRKLSAVFDALTAAQMPLLIHGEVTDSDVDVFDREAVFIERELKPLLDSYPSLRIVLEHITTRAAVDLVQNGPPTLAATITAHHLLLNRNALFTGGIRPHNYCLPILKREVHRQALLGALRDGHPRFFLGTDSAPHSQVSKETACGCAGIYTAHAALELYAEAFELAGALHHLNDFAAHRGPDFYGLPRNTGTVTLIRRPWQSPASFQLSNKGDMINTTLIPFRAGESIAWSMISKTSVTDDHGN